MGLCQSCRLPQDEKPLLSPHACKGVPIVIGSTRDNVGEYDSDMVVLKCTDGEKCFARQSMKLLPIEVQTLDLERYKVTQLEITSLIEYTLTGDTPCKSIVNSLIVRCGLLSVVSLSQNKPCNPLSNAADEYEWRVATCGRGINYYIEQGFEPAGVFNDNQWWMRRKLLASSKSATSTKSVSVQVTM